jgi:hypothetical protein
MGYYMSQRDADFFIPRANFPKLLELLGCLDGAYSWVGDFQGKDSVEDSFAGWRWPVVLDDEGNIDGIEFSGEKLGDDSCLFEKIAPCVRPGSFVEMLGEDGHLWRWAFDGENCKEISPSIVWPDLEGA